MKSSRMGFIAPVLAVALLWGTPPGFGDDARPHGLQRRTPWTTSRVLGSPEPPPPFRTEEAFPNLKIQQPLTFELEPGTNSYLVLQHLGSWAPPGRLARVADRPDVDHYDVVLDFGDKTIAYGLDFHPRYLENGYLYIGLNTENEAGVHFTQVRRYTVDREPPYAIDPKSELVVIEWESNGHNGGDLAFGNDGMLYVSSGDGTSDSDLNNRGQDMTHLTSKILRIDVDHPAPGQNYSSPPDNPFTHVPGARPETWAIGLRNPWRLTHDKATGQLWCGVNGQDLWETVNLIERGANYGWSVTEGSHPFLSDRKLGPAPLTPPTVEHHHSEARSLTGGVVYHGRKYPELDGAYVYGDWSTGKVWAVKHDGERVVFHREIADTPFQLTGFGLDSDGELILIDHQTAFHRLIPSAPEDVKTSRNFPRKLSETGLFASVVDRDPAPGVIPYDVNAPLWSDGAGKERLMAVPGEAKVEFTEQNGWNFPDGTVLAKTFLLDLADRRSAGPAPVETRLMVKEQGEWVGYAYLWNDDRADATLVDKEGLDKTYLVNAGRDGETKAQTWRFPSRAECMVCHTRAANFVLGPSTPQMNRDFDYGGVVDNQIRTLEHIGFFSNEVPEPDKLARLADPSNPAEPLAERARAYLHSNCATCHVEAGGGNASIDLSIGASPHRLGVNAEPRQETFGIQRPLLIAPGDAESSTVFARMTRRGPGQMPPLGTSLVDDEAMTMIRAWIDGLADPGPPPPGPAPPR